jgi:hypothetical protein
VNKYSGMSMSRVGMCLGAAVILITQSACDVSRTLENVTLLVSNSGSVTLGQLSATPADFDLVTSIATLTPSVAIGGKDGEILHLADATLLPDGRLAVLDREASQLLVFSSERELESRWGQRGQGPGELRSPIAITSTADGVIVWDTDPQQTFVSYGWDGETLATTRTPVAGDWAHIAVRWPVFPEGRYQMPIGEDVTDRLAGSSTRYFYHQIQDDERFIARNGTAVDVDSPPVYIIRYDGNLAVVDTVLILEGPPSVRLPDLGNSYPRFSQPVWAARPLWAVGEWGFATTHGDSAAISISTPAGETSAVISWQASHRQITQSEKLRWAEWIWEAQARTLPESSQNLVPRGREKDRWLEMTVETGTFATNRPEVTVLASAGKCLFVGGYSPESNIRARGLTLAVIRVAPMELLGLVRIPRTGSRIRFVTKSAIWSSYQDDADVAVLERYALPFSSC